MCGAWSPFWSTVKRKSANARYFLLFLKFIDFSRWSILHFKSNYHQSLTANCVSLIFASWFTLIQGNISVCPLTLPFLLPRPEMSLVPVRWLANSSSFIKKNCLRKDFWAHNLTMHLGSLPDDLLDWPSMFNQSRSKWPPRAETWVWRRLGLSG